MTQLPNCLTILPTKFLTQQNTKGRKATMWEPPREQPNVIYIYIYVNIPIYDTITQLFNNTAYQVPHSAEHKGEKGNKVGATQRAAKRNIYIYM